MRSEDTARFAAAARSPYGARYFRAACWLGLLLGCYAGIRAAASAAGVPSDLRAKHPVDLVADVQVIMLLGTLQGWAVDIRTPVNSFEYCLIVNDFHKIQNFRQISDLFPQI